MTRDVYVRDTASYELTDQAAQLDAVLNRGWPVLGAFSLAGFPDERRGIDALIAYAQRGAAVLEVGVPTSTPWLDGPVIHAAHRRALLHGYGLRMVVETVREAAAATASPIVVMSYWSSVHEYGPEYFADVLAAAGAAGCLVPDLPEAHTPRWRAAMERAGIHAPVLADRQASTDQLASVCQGASGFVYAPAVPASTGYRGPLDFTELAAFAASVRRTAPAVPVVTGIGVSTPELASALVREVDVSAVVIGSPFIRALHSDSDGLRQAERLVGEFAAAVAIPRMRR